MNKYSAFYDVVGDKLRRFVEACRKSAAALLFSLAVAEIDMQNGHLVCCDQCPRRPLLRTDELTVVSIIAPLDEDALVVRQ